MDWITASLLSAFFLGLYELSTKHAVNHNAVVPVLFFSTLFGGVLWAGLLVASRTDLVALPEAFSVTPLTPARHGLLLLKSLIVAVSWSCSYFALKHLPMSIASPIRATGPLWTLFGALLVLGERPTLLEGAGIVLTLGSFVGLSLAGRQEGLHFHRNRWIFWAIAGTIFNGISALYDKYLLGTAGFDAPTVQCWFAIYLVVMFLPLLIGWMLRWWPRQAFEWRWSILAITAALLVADFIYFDALRDPDALISVVSSFRRGSTIVAFAGGFLLFRETNLRQKLPAAIGVLAGIVLTILG